MPAVVAGRRTRDARSRAACARSTPGTAEPNVSTTCHAHHGQRGHTPPQRQDELPPPGPPDGTAERVDVEATDQRTRRRRARLRRRPLRPPAPNRRAPPPASDRGRGAPHPPGRRRRQRQEPRQHSHDLSDRDRGAGERLVADRHQRHRDIGRGRRPLGRDRGEHRGDDGAEVGDPQDHGVGLGLGQRDVGGLSGSAHRCRQRVAARGADRDRLDQRRQRDEVRS